jgi:hypothetical protein
VFMVFEGLSGGFLLGHTAVSSFIIPKCRAIGSS